MSLMPLKSLSNVAIFFTLKSRMNATLVQSVKLRLLADSKSLQAFSKTETSVIAMNISENLLLHIFYAYLPSRLPPALPQGHSRSHQVCDSYRLGNVASSAADSYDFLCFFQSRSGELHVKNPCFMYAACFFNELYAAFFAELYQRLFHLSRIRNSPHYDYHGHFCFAADFCNVYQVKAPESKPFKQYSLQLRIELAFCNHLYYFGSGVCSVHVNN